jgi:hypothetical protein
MGGCMDVKAVLQIAYSNKKGARLSLKVYLLSLQIIPNVT